MSRETWNKFFLTFLNLLLIVSPLSAATKKVAAGSAYRGEELIPTNLQGPEIPFSNLKQRLSIGTLKPIRNLLPFSERLTPQETEILINIYEGFTLCNRDKDYSFGLGGSITQPYEDKRLWRLTVQDEQYWSPQEDDDELEPITSEQLLYCWRRLYDPKSYNALQVPKHRQEVLLTALPFLDNAEAVMRGEKSPDALGFSLQEDGSILLSLTRQVSQDFLLFHLANEVFLPIRDKDILVLTKAMKRGTLKNFGGNGPYYIAEWNRDGKTILKRNPYYWTDRRKDKDPELKPPLSDYLLREVSYTLYHSEEEMIKDWKAGELDCFPSLVYFEPEDPQYVKQILGPLVEDYLWSIRTTNKYLLEFGNQRPEFKDRACRQAISLLIDQFKLWQKSLRLPADPDKCSFAENFKNFCLGKLYGRVYEVGEDSPYTETDEVEHAKAILEKLGYSEDNPFILTLLHSEKERPGTIVLSELEKQLNQLSPLLQVKFEFVEFNKLAEKKFDKDFELIFWETRYPSPLPADYFLPYANSEEGELFKKLLERLVKKHLESEERIDTVKDLDYVFTEEIPAIVLAPIYRVMVFNDRVGGKHDYYVRHPTGAFFYSNMFTKFPHRRGAFRNRRRRGYWKRTWQRIAKYGGI